MYHHLPVTTGKYDQKIWMMHLKKLFLSAAKETDLRSRSCTSIYNLMKMPIAIRSLQMPDHAYHIPPRVRTISWMIGRRCNYDCSYCSSHQHDAVSPWLDLTAGLDFVDRLHASGHPLKYNFTGGEPFLDPGFLPMLRHLSALDTTQQINAITNGSLPRSVYQQASQYLTGITFSLHLERTPAELAAIIDRMRDLPDCFINANIMFLPGRLAQVQTLTQRLDDLDINYVVRAIADNQDFEELMPYHALTADLKSRQLVGAKQQTARKIHWRQQADRDRYQRKQVAYAPQELEYLQSINADVRWHNCGVWTQDDYQEINTDLLVSNDLNRFRGWQCWSGVDSIYVDATGSVFRAQCLNGGAVGSLSDFDGFCTEPTSCDMHYCNCNVDIATRKCAPAGQHHVDL